MAKSRLHQLSEAGVSVWIDNLSRDLIQSGELERMMRCLLYTSPSPRDRS